MKRILATVGRSLFSTSGSQPPQYTNFYLLRLQYGEDGYYETYQFKNKFAEQIKSIENQCKAKILGGNSFSNNSTTLIFHCNSKQIPENFANTCVYNKKLKFEVNGNKQQKILKKYELVQLDKISNEKFQKIWQFYQPQLK